MNREIDFIFLIVSKKIFFSELKMYLKLGRSLVNIKKIEHQFRNFSAYSGCACTTSNIFENNNARINLKPTESIISSCFISRRNFSVSGFRFQDLGGETSAAIHNALTESIEVSPSLNISENISSESTLDSSDEVLSVTNTSNEGAGNIAEAASAETMPTDETKEIILDFLPEKPVPLDPTAILGEPAFDSLGLGSWWPSGRLQIFMEYLHVDLGNLIYLRNKTRFFYKVKYKKIENKNKLFL